MTQDGRRCECERERETCLTRQGRGDRARRSHDDDREPRLAQGFLKPNEPPHDPRRVVDVRHERVRQVEVHGIAREHEGGEGCQPDARSRLPSQGVGPQQTDCAGCERRKPQRLEERPVSQREQSADQDVRQRRYVGPRRAAELTVFQQPTNGERVSEVVIAREVPRPIHQRRRKSPQQQQQRAGDRVVPSE
jgi:hypothetical protein